MKNFDVHIINVTGIDSVTKMMIFILLLILIFWIMPSAKSAIVVKRIVSLIQLLPVTKIFLELEKIRNFKK